MVMLDNKLCLISVMEFLRRSREDHGARKGKLVVGTDLSKRKVHRRLTDLPRFRVLKMQSFP